MSGRTDADMHSGVPGSQQQKEEKANMLCKRDRSEASGPVELLCLRAVALCATPPRPPVTHIP